MPLLTLPHIDISYEEHGDPHGTPVFLLHGFPDSAAGWRALIAAWQGEPVRWIVPMLRGYGSSRITDPKAETGEISAIADDILMLQKSLGVDRAT